MTFQHCSIFDARIAERSYDLVYDSGCFQHLAPHRRRDYVRLVSRALKPGGSYGLVCFQPEGGRGYTDQEVYEQGSLGGGLGYTERQLRDLWDSPPFSVRVLRQMAKAGEHGPYFGEDFLWTLLAIKGRTRTALTAGGCLTLPARTGSPPGGGDRARDLSSGQAGPLGRLG